MAHRGGAMCGKKSLSKLFFSLLTLIIFAAFASDAVVFGQDPTGQPTAPSKGGKKPPKKPTTPANEARPFHRHSDDNYRPA
jgi:hypothetical protein